MKVYDIEIRIRVVVLTDQDPAPKLMKRAEEAARLALPVFSKHDDPEMQGRRHDVASEVRSCSITPALTVTQP